MYQARKQADYCKDTFLYSDHPQPLWQQGLVWWKAVFPETGRGDGFRMIQALYIYYVLCLCYYYISSTSDYQALITEVALEDGGDLSGRRPDWG